MVTARDIAQGARAFITGTPLSEIQRQARVADMQEQQNFLNLDRNRQQALFDDARVTNSLLNSGETGRALSLLTERAQVIGQVGGDPSDTLEVASLIQSGDIQGAKNLLKAVEDAGVSGGFLKPLKTASTDKMTANIADFLFHQDLIKQGKTDEAAAFANKSNLSRLSPEEQAALQVESSTMKEQGKERAKRLSGFVNDGVGAADSVGNMRRALALLDSVKTGGFDNAALRVKQFFGVEGANEGELSNNLGKAVLSQLRSTFGAAFTAKEGEQLQRIESGFGKSTDTNKRLLRNALRTAEKAAKRGARAADSLGDDFSAEEIRLALDNSLSQEFDFTQPLTQQPAQQQPSVQPATSGFKILRVRDN